MKGRTKRFLPNFGRAGSARGHEWTNSMLSRVLALVIVAYGSGVGVAHAAPEVGAQSKPTVTAPAKVVRKTQPAVRRPAAAAARRPVVRPATPPKAAAAGTAGRLMLVGIGFGH